MNEAIAGYVGIVSAMVLAELPDARLEWWTDVEFLVLTTRDYKLKLKVELRRSVTLITDGARQFSFAHTRGAAHLDAQQVIDDLSRARARDQRRGRGGF